MLFIEEIQLPSSKIHLRNKGYSKYDIEQTSHSWMSVHAMGENGRQREVETSDSFLSEYYNEPV